MELGGGAGAIVPQSARRGRLARHRRAGALPSASVAGDGTPTSYRCSFIASVLKLRSGPRRFLGDGRDERETEEKRRRIIPTPARKVVSIGAVAEMFYVSRRLAEVVGLLSRECLRLARRLSRFNGLRRLRAAPANLANLPVSVP